MAYKLDQKLKDLEFERKQVLEHLTLLDVKINTVQKAITLMKAEEDIACYNTENFIYRQKRKLFKGKIRKYLVQILRNEPNKGFTIADLTQRIFEIEQNQDTPTEKHLDSVRKQLNEFYQRDWITRTQISRKEVLWQWKLK
ncbi:hypothetical protein [Rodentibacter trehalosifermentans]|uniref:hypothetical protein n=1 Tax=Rodentibacter trehalosifermentans TaxID=1908263 RepID=UPI0009861B5E|nr:hypothetical protein [Rodentibacter trehalosifermentans]OOF52621.1 hypothetical protein BKK53_04540 [Rodentibacter trehalosifermentans]